jgi:hypothetical protein
VQKILLGTTALFGVGALAGAAQASDGIKLAVGGFFQTVYGGVFDKKSQNRFGNHHTVDRFIHNAEVHFMGETTLDNGLTIGARVELEGENADGQIDDAFVYWQGGFGQVQIGSQSGAVSGYCLLPPGATANFSAFSPAAWGSNDPRGSNPACSDNEGGGQKIVYTTPDFAGFQLHVSYTPNVNAQDYTTGGVNGHGTPSSPDGVAQHAAGFYVGYAHWGDDWGVQWGGGIDHQFKFNHDRVDDVNDGRSTSYQTGLNVFFHGFAIGAVTEYFANGGHDNDTWVIGGGASYSADPWTVGVQGSHGRFNATAGDPTGTVAGGFGDGDGGHDTLNRIVATGAYALAPGITFDAEIGYTWYHNGTPGVPSEVERYHAFDIQVGSALTF